MMSKYLQEFDEHLKSWVEGCVSDGSEQTEFEDLFEEFWRAPDTRDVLRDCFHAAYMNA